MESNTLESEQLPPLELLELTKSVESRLEIDDQVVDCRTWTDQAIESLGELDWQEVAQRVVLCSNESMNMPHTWLELYWCGEEGSEEVFVWDASNQGFLKEAHLKSLAKARVDWPDFGRGDNQEIVVLPEETDA